MDPESLVLMAVSTDDLKLLKIGLLLRMDDYVACLKSAMLVACTEGKLDMVQELLSAGAIPTEHLLWTTCVEGHIPIVSTLIEQASFVVTKQGLAIAIDIATRYCHHDLKLYLSNLPQASPDYISPDLANVTPLKV